MINLGFRSGRNMPDVYVELTPIDRILEGLVALLVVAVWVLAVVFYFDSPLLSSQLFIRPCIMIVSAVLFLWASRAPIRFYNFPVKLNERNYVMQYIIASRFTRVVSVIVTLILCWEFFINLEPQLNISHGLFSTFEHITIGLLLLSFVGYYVFAFRYR